VDSWDSHEAANQIQDCFLEAVFGCDGPIGFELCGVGPAGAADHRSAGPEGTDRTRQPESIASAQISGGNPFRNDRPPARKAAISIHTSIRTAPYTRRGPFAKTGFSAILQKYTTLDLRANEGRANSGATANLRKPFEAEVLPTSSQKMGTKRENADFGNRKGEPRDWARTETAQDLIAIYKQHGSTYGAGLKHQHDLTGRVLRGGIAEEPVLSEMAAVTSMATCISCHEVQHAKTDCATCHGWPSDNPDGPITQSSPLALPFEVDHPASSPPR
jgi:hypothetical protein